MSELGPKGHEVPRPPAGLPGELQEAWEELAAPLAREGLLSELDADSAIQLVLAHHLTRQAVDQLLEGGLVVEGWRGHPRKNAAWGVYRDAQAALRQWYCEFGMTPSARTRLHVIDGNETGSFPWNPFSDEPEEEG